MSNQTPQPRHARDIQAPPNKTVSIAQAWPKSGRNVLIIISALCLIISAIGWWTLGRAAGSLGNGGDFGLGETKDGATDILLVGSDSRVDAQGNPLTPEEVELLRAGDEEATNTDTLIVIRVPNDGSSATAISIPRDTYVSNEEFGNLKINGVFSAAQTKKQDELAAAGVTDSGEVEKQSTEAGRKALIDQIGDLTGVTVDHFAEVGLLGFVLLTDAIGGVDVCLNAPVYDEYSGANFEAGEQTLKGSDALSFVRQRHGLPRGDLDRITRQQVYMASFANKVLSAGTLSNPGKLSELGKAVQRSVVLDDQWDVTGFATQMQGLTGGNIKFETIPVTSIDGTGDYGESVVTVDKGQVHTYFDTLLGPKDGPREDAEGDNADKADGHDPAKVSVSVYNATGIEGLAAAVSDELSSKGYQKGEVANAEFAGVAQSQVNAVDPEDPAAKAISEALGGIPIVHDTSLEPGHISVTVAGDYQGPGLDAAAAAATEAAINEEMADAPTPPPGANGDVVGQEGGAPIEQPEQHINAGGIMCVN